jgi:hypothetical protein
MRHLRIERPDHASGDRDRSFAPDRENARGNEAFQVLWELGIHLAVFLGIAFTVNLIVVLLGASPTPP